MIIETDKRNTNYQLFFQIGILKRSLWNRMDAWPDFNACIRNHTRCTSNFWLEREISTGIQQRIGPEYAGPLGILQALADGTKLLFKDNLLPSRADTHLFGIGLSIAVLSIFLSYSVITFSYRFILTDLTDLSIGIFL